MVSPSSVQNAQHSTHARAEPDRGDYNIRVNGLAPGPIEDTPGYVKLAGPNDNVRDLVAYTVPLGRPGTVQEMGDCAVFLCSSAANYVSGHVLVADGGNTLWSPAPAPRDNVRRFSRDIEPKSREVGKAKL